MYCMCVMYVIYVHVCVCRLCTYQMDARMYICNACMSVCNDIHFCAYVMLCMLCLYGVYVCRLYVCMLCLCVRLYVCVVCMICKVTLCCVCVYVCMRAVHV